jgi:hypothetical protein
MHLHYTRHRPPIWIFRPLLSIHGRLWPSDSSCLQSDGARLLLLLLLALLLQRRDSPRSPTERNMRSGLEARRSDGGGGGGGGSGQ